MGSHEREQLPGDPFDCPTYGKLSRDECQDRFVLAHAPPDEQSPCHGCRIGTKVRLTYCRRGTWAPAAVVRGAHSYYTDDRASYGHKPDVDRFKAWVGLDDKEDDDDVGDPAPPDAAADG